MKPNSMRNCGVECEDEPESYVEYFEAVRRTNLEGIKEIIAHIKGGSLREEDKNTLLKDIIRLTYRQL